MISANTNFRSAFVMAAAVMFSGICAAQAHYQHNLTRGPGPGGVDQAVFTVHRLGTDHAEGITTLDMNGDGRPDILSGAYWYENPGPQGGEWKRHQYREVGTLGEFVSDCGEWTIDVNHDGKPDVVTAGWMTNGIFWWENPGKLGAEWKKHFITDSYDTEGGAIGDASGGCHGVRLGKPRRAAGAVASNERGRPFGRPRMSSGGTSG